MATEEFKRRLTAILSADVEGYSRLMREDEEATIRTLKTYRTAIRDLVGQYRGRVVDSPGDNILAEFASALDAVNCAVEIQRELAERNTELPENRRMHFRIGINLGDIVEDGERIYGDGVNIAARMEGLAEGGGICISGKVYEEVKHKLGLEYEYQGEQEVKNIPEPVRVYKVLSFAGAAPHRVVKAKKAVRKTWRNTMIAIVALLVLGATVVIWHFYSRLPPIEPASVDRMAQTLPDKPSIAVLSFGNLSDDPDQEYFSDGLCEDLITDLSKISGLFVIARNSSFAYKGKDVKIRQIAEELGVRYVLEGSVRKVGDQVRINAQLIDATRGHHMWAERYDGRLNDIFVLQDKVTRKIVTALALKLTPDEKRLIAQRGTTNVAAHDSFLKGWNHYVRLTAEDMVKAVVYLKEALELDPNYGRAQAALALVYWHGTRFQGPMQGLLGAFKMSWWEARLRACQYLEVAMKNPTSIAHTLQSERYLNLRLHEKAIAEAGHALALDPNNSTCHAAMADALAFGGRPKEAIDYARNGMRLDPQNPARYLRIIALAHFCMGKLEEAASFYEDASKHDPEQGSAVVPLASTYAHLGLDPEARATLEMHKKRWVEITGGRAPYTLPFIMFFYPFHGRLLADRLAQGLLKAGLPGKLSDYYPLFEENRLTGDEMRALLFGSTITGSSFGGAQWWIERNKEGEITLRGGPLGPDSGETRIEGEMYYTRMQRAWWGIEYSGTIFRNPNGSPERMNEYVSVMDVGIQPFSLVR
jgi:adenylate cyclase